MPLIAVALPGCQGTQSALSPAGSEAEATLTLFVVMSFGAAAIWFAVVAFVCFAVRSQRRVFAEPAASRLVLWGGGVFPTVTLFALLTYAFWLMPTLRPSPTFRDATDFRVEVTGRQYWWQVVYVHRGLTIAAANEIRLPVGRRIEFLLKSDDVIHSFWIPSLGGKMDMIPGRENRLSLMAQRTGVFRGACAEFCGTSHAFMALTAVTMEPDAFDAWLASQAKASINVAGEGRALFLRHGCGSCHRVAGTEAAGAAGPDLSHLGSRQMLGAGIVANTEDNIAGFIANPGAIKPGAAMPAFSMLAPQDIRAIAAWLKGLR
ncbi:cytochrome c oxidase subunit II [Ensifer sp. ENS06]|nr:cytochrome c oxidase subunit II [Ensifer sp. ENS06]